jgi:hypothetical protein
MEADIQTHRANCNSLGPIAAIAKHFGGVVYEDYPAVRPSQSHSRGLYLLGYCVSLGADVFATGSAASKAFIERLGAVAIVQTSAWPIPTPSFA